MKALAAGGYEKDVELATARRSIRELKAQVAAMQAELTNSRAANEAELAAAKRENHSSRANIQQLEKQLLVLRADLARYGADADAELAASRKEQEALRTTIR